MSDRMSAAIDLFISLTNASSDPRRIAAEEAWTKRLRDAGYKYAEAYSCDDGRAVLVLNSNLQLGALLDRNSAIEHAREARTLVSDVLNRYTTKDELIVILRRLRELLS